MFCHHQIAEGTLRTCLGTLIRIKLVKVQNLITTNACVPVQFYEDSCLVKQKFVMSDDQSVQVRSGAQCKPLSHSVCSLLHVSSSSACLVVFSATQDVQNASGGATFEHALIMREHLTCIILTLTVPCIDVSRCLLHFDRSRLC